ncbi:MAG: DUF1501 domain-containing protein [Candidatus Riflebacteria bacterium]|nr:DUF1501 domain-containing protein [Candidatus Riflebacteria bacterium]
MSRRGAIKTALAWGAGVALIDPLTGLAAPEDEKKPVPADPKAPARSVIQIWLAGGPCHLDTFDPKPEAGNDFSGPLAKPIPTSVPGVMIGELLPMLAQQADKYSLIRSLTHGVNAHETASYLVQTGHQPGEGLVHPCLGAVVALLKGYDHGYQGLVPPYVVLTTSQGRFSESGFLGEQYAPFATGGDPNQKRFAVEGIISEEISDARLLGRRELLKTLDTLGMALPTSPQFDRFNQAEKKALVTVAKAGTLFDLSQEKDELRNRYGRTTFGQSCLVARRLVEHGVRYITINSGGWDTHKQHFQIMRRMLPELDRGLSTLLSELSERGLLDSTIVWCCGEFGRTPRVQWAPPWNGGRGHHGKCFSVLVAGGGFKGGRVVGASDSRGEEVTDRPVHPQDLLGSICKLLGIDPAAKLPNDRGLDLQVMPSTEGGRGLLAEIM